MAKIISCSLATVQLGNSRFTKREERPALSTWRCELTALSQVYNLYFVAYSEYIYVYQPNFPDQHLADEPDLILHPPVSSPNLEPGIDPLCPHSITRILIDFLGNEEIVLVTCDDGDVIGYSVPQIQQAVEKRAEGRCSEQEPVGDEIRVFLHRNVEGSAWGLAVHREARMIAISANTKVVTVLAFALASPEESDSYLDSYMPNGPDASDFPYPRQQDHIFTLPAEHNIPSVSFDNSGADSTGRWLLSAVVSGQVHLWDLHNPDAPARTIQTGFCAGVHNPKEAPAVCTCADAGALPHAAWNAMFVDTRSCRKTYSIRDALGSNPLQYTPCIWVSKASLEIDWKNGLLAEDSKIDFEPITPHFDSDDEGNGNGHESENESDKDEDQEIQEAWEAFVEPGNTLDDGSASESESEDVDHEIPDAAEDVGEPGEDEDIFASGLEAEVQEAPQAAEGVSSLQQDEAISESGSEEEGESQTEQQLSVSGLGFQQMVEATLRQPTTVKRSYFKLKTEPGPRQPAPKCPIIIITKEDVYLVQLFKPPNRSIMYDRRNDPVIAARNPLFVNNGDPYTQKQCDRLCFAAQIPELGIFIVGSPLGRVAIFRLTQFQTQHEGRQDTVYGFRQEYLIPATNRLGHVEATHNQLGRLVGMAVSPVQGMLDLPAEEVEEEKENPKLSAEQRTSTAGGRRWRLMLHYSSHTVLTYDIGKFQEEEETSLGALVV